MGKLNKEIKMLKPNELEQKREIAKKALPELRALIKKHGFEAVNYTWQKVIAKERDVARARQEADAAQKRADALEKELAEEL